MKNIGRGIIVTIAISILTVLALSIDIVPTSATILKRYAIDQSDRPVLKTSAKTEADRLPQVVKSAVVSKYIAYFIHTVSEGKDGVYKIILKNEHSGLVVYYHKNGEFLNQEELKPVRMVALMYPVE